MKEYYFELFEKEPNKPALAVIRVTAESEHEAREKAKEYLLSGYLIEDVDSLEDAEELLEEEEHEWAPDEIVEI
jgi:DNA-dependent RNA polymerase auxiliary subunit epsilon